MEFNFDISEYFNSGVTKIGPRLIPENFSGGRREVQECMSRISEIVTALGESSAKAQGLQKVITSGDRLRNSDHTVYLLAEPNSGARGYGTVLGMLKVGVKHLYVFDSSGNNHEVYANCVLDFYVHESKQRLGLGKKLFEFMLQKENVEHHHLAIDKPSPKLLSFLHKHYDLETIIPQMNNFVLFEGFFDNRHDGDNKDGRNKVMAAGKCSSTDRYLRGGLGSFSEQPASPRQHLTSTSSVAPGITYGRHAAHHPVSTMGLILQNQPPTEAAAPTASRADSVVTPTPEPAEQTEVSVQAEVEQLTLQIEDEAPEEIVEAVPIEAPTPEPLPCKIQAATAPHLDLKFYHSSLWCILYRHTNLQPCEHAPLAAVGRGEPVQCAYKLAVDVPSHSGKWNMLTPQQIQVAQAFC